MKFSVLLSALLLSASFAMADESSTNKPAETSHAVKALKIKAEQGDADAEFSLGGCYYEGIGVTQDKAEAVRWYEKAAEHGIVEAQFMVGLNYWLGMDVKMDEAKGAKWFQKAAEEGEPGAIFYLGGAYYLGKGVKQDYVQSYKWILVFKESGHGLIPKDMSDAEYKIKELESKLTKEQIAEGKRLAKEKIAELRKKPRFSETS